MFTCIYCLQNLSREHFNKEHVIARQLGSFQDSPTLIRAVCMGCNRYFGNTSSLLLGVTVSKRSTGSDMARSELKNSKVSAASGSRSGFLAMRRAAALFWCRQRVPTVETL